MIHSFLVTAEVKGQNQCLSVTACQAAQVSFGISECHYNACYIFEKFCLF